MFYINISNGLLEDDHQKRMGPAVWQFMWCIDKVTKIDEDGTGWVLGGKPVQLKDLANNVTEDTVSRNLKRLDGEGYIMVKRTPYGLIISVSRAKKRFGKKVESGNDEKVESDTAKKSNHSAKMSNVIKTNTGDINSMTGRATPAQEAREFFKSDTKQFEVVKMLVDSGLSDSMAKAEVSKFVSYWTEKNKSGTKQKWELETTFEISRRLATWFRNAGKFNKNITQQVNAVIL